MCIYIPEGFNRNPNMIQFRTTIRQILLCNSIESSKTANVLAFEARTQNSIFSLAIKRNKHPLPIKYPLTKKPLIPLLIEMLKDPLNSLYTVNLLITFSFIFQVI